MARVEIYKEYIGVNETVIKEPLFKAGPKESPPPDVRISTPGGEYIQTTFRPNNQGEVFDVFQADPSVRVDSYNVEKIDEAGAPFYNVGTVQPGEPFIMQHIKEDGIEYSIVAHVLPDTIRLPLVSSPQTSEQAA